MSQDKLVLQCTLETLDQTAAMLLAAFKDFKLWFFEGDLGVGKTTLIKALMLQLGIEDAGSSPTYGIIHSYGAAYKTLYHMDLYRIKNAEELWQLGIDDYFYSGFYCFIEWPNLAKPFADKGIWIHISQDDTQKRTITAAPF